MIVFHVGGKGKSRGVEEEKKEYVACVGADGCVGSLARCPVLKCELLAPLMRTDELLPPRYY